ncbi:hypothetical protein [Acetoanaerobium noterae]|uniref:hypothetical protein n=1 Tax=Acetoanaerobium noterae TaxID=745369 RepID=UPI0028AA5F28|nr:hypothetical protein [Acetoanaerobium noterae]
MSKKTTFFSKLKFLIIGLLFLVMFGIVIGLLVTVALDLKNSEEQNLSNSSKEIEEIDTEESTISEETISMEPETGEVTTPIDDIALLIGRDLPSGVYKLVSDMPTAFYRISMTPQANFIDIKDNDVFSKFTYIKVEDGDYLTLIDADAIPLAEAPVTSFENIATHKNAKYLVGKDINPGSYTVYPDDKYGFVEISSEPINTPSNIVLSSYISSPISINLVEGQFFKISQSKITLNQ